MRKHHRESPESKTKGKKTCHEIFAVARCNNSLSLCKFFFMFLLWLLFVRKNYSLCDSKTAAAELRWREMCNKIRISREQHLLMGKESAIARRTSFTFSAVISPRFVVLAFLGDWVAGALLMIHKRLIERHFAKSFLKFCSLLRLRGVVDFHVLPSLLAWHNSDGRL